MPCFFGELKNIYRAFFNTAPRFFRAAACVFLSCTLVFECGVIAMARGDVFGACLRPPASRVSSLEPNRDNIISGALERFSDDIDMTLGDVLRHIPGDMRDDARRRLAYGMAQIREADRELYEDLFLRLALLVAHDYREFTIFTIRGPHFIRQLPSLDSPTATAELSHRIAADVSACRSAEEICEALRRYQPRAGKRIVNETNLWQVLARIIYANSAHGLTQDEIMARIPQGIRMRYGGYVPSTLSVLASDNPTRWGFGLVTADHSNGNTVYRPLATDELVDVVAAGEPSNGRQRPFTAADVHRKMRSIGLPKKRYTEVRLQEALDRIAAQPESDLLCLADGRYVYVADAAVTKAQFQSVCVTGRTISENLVRGFVLQKYGYAQEDNLSRVCALVEAVYQGPAAFADAVEALDEGRLPLASAAVHFLLETTRSADGVLPLLRRISVSRVSPVIAYISDEARVRSCVEAICRQDRQWAVAVLNEGSEFAQVTLSRLIGESDDAKIRAVAREAEDIRNSVPMPRVDFEDFIERLRACTYADTEATMSEAETALCALDMGHGFYTEFPRIPALKVYKKSAKISAIPCLGKRIRVELTQEGPHRVRVNFYLPEFEAQGPVYSAVWDNTDKTLTRREDELYDWVEGRDQSAAIEGSYIPVGLYHSGNNGIYWAFTVPLSARASGERVDKKYLRPVSMGSYAPPDIASRRYYSVKGGKEMPHGFYWLCPRTLPDGARIFSVHAFRGGPIIGLVQISEKGFSPMLTPADLNPDAPRFGTEVRAPVLAGWITEAAWTEGLLTQVNRPRRKVPSKGENDSVYGFGITGVGYSVAEGDFGDEVWLRRGPSRRIDAYQERSDDTGPAQLSKWFHPELGPLGRFVDERSEAQLRLEQWRARETPQEPGVVTDMKRNGASITPLPLLGNYWEGRNCFIRYELIEGHRGVALYSLDVEGRITGCIGAGYFNRRGVFVASAPWGIAQQLPLARLMEVQSEGYRLGLLPQLVVPRIVVQASAYAGFKNDPAYFAQLADEGGFDYAGNGLAQWHEMMEEEHIRSALNKTTGPLYGRERLLKEVRALHRRGELFLTVTAQRPESFRLIVSADALFHLGLQGSWERAMREAGIDLDLVTPAHGVCATTESA